VIESSFSVRQSADVGIMRLPGRPKGPWLETAYLDVSGAGWGPLLGPRSGGLTRSK
jgi:hypothetical protein